VGNSRLFPAVTLVFGLFLSKSKLKDIIFHQKEEYCIIFASEYTVKDM
jgi:hypothetical protein